MTVCNRCKVDKNEPFNLHEKYCDRCYRNIKILNKQSVERKKQKREKQKQEKRNELKKNDFEDIPGFEGYYLINRKAEIYSLATNRILKNSLACHGYLRVNLHNKDVKKQYRVHRLVALTFVPNPHNYNEVDHIDRDKTNNNAKNLRWCNRSENLQNRVITGTIRRIKTTNGQKRVYYYWEAHFKSKTKRSVDIKVCEKWLEQQRKSP